MSQEDNERTEAAGRQLDASRPARRRGQPGPRRILAAFASNVYPDGDVITRFFQLSKDVIRWWELWDNRIS